ncbi:MAG: hypothetical protein R3337_00425 [Gammaproteobacteria bacterium]|nr:hypothetical protein [Gammaproteobacteria bacterium]
MGYSFEGGELQLAARLYNGFSGLDSSQPTNRNAIMGAQSAPLGQTIGNMEPGTLTVEWTDLGQMMAFLTDLASFGPYREVPFGASYTMRAPGRDVLLVECNTCLLVDEPISASSGEVISSSMEISYLYRRLNGNAPHSGM